MLPAVAAAPAEPAAVSATAAAVAAEANARLQTAAWLQWTTNGDPVASLLAEKYWLHQSLAQAAWLLRRLLGQTTHRRSPSPQMSSPT